MSQNSLDNLKKGVAYQFKEGEKKPTEEVIKREATKKENRLVSDICIKWIEKNFGIALDKLERDVKNGKISPDTLVRILQFIADYAGQKPVERQEIVGGDLNIQVVNDNN